MTSTNLKDRNSEANSTKDNSAALAAAKIASWGQLNPFRLRAVQQHAGRSVLDVGCSTGGYVAYLNRHGYTAFGLDLLSDPAWHSTFQHNVVGSAEILPFADNAVETTIAFEVLEHVPAVQAMLLELHRVSKKNILLSVPDCRQPQDLLQGGLTFSHWRDRTHTNFFTPDTLKCALEEAGFGAITVTPINAILPDYPMLRSFYLPHALAHRAARVLKRIPFRKTYHMTLLAVAKKV